jgi:hypothetical protein
LRNWVILGVVGGGFGLAAGGPWLGDGVGVVPVGSRVGVSGCGAEEAGVEVSGAVLVGEELGCFFFFFFGEGGTRGSASPAVSSSAPVLLAPVSWVSGGEVRSSSAR